MSSDDRPDPDQLLERVRAAEAHANRGKLRIFLGYAAGVGKTYAMLRAAHHEKDEGREVVVGYVEPHGRKQTEALLEGLEQLPHKLIPYRGVTLREFDLDAALARKPQLLLVDELAHTNAEGLRHAKRWQDVEELLEAGIDVYTTLNVQHVESLNDVIAQITGVVVQETLPDAVLEKADDFELIDITPEELLERLRAGNVYVPEQAERALRHFFQPQNLTALRELSLRQAANRLRRDVDAARESLRRTQPWATNERILVCIGPSPTTARLIRSAKRMAAAFGAEWMAVAVEVAGKTSSPDAKARIARHLRMAEQLGASTHTLSGTSIAGTLLDFARARNVSKIIIGKTAQPFWKRALIGTVVDELLEQSGAIDVYVILGEPEDRPAVHVPSAPQKIDWNRYLLASGIVGLCAAAAAVGQYLRSSEANVVMLFLLGVVWVAYRYGRGPAVWAAVASVMFFDFLFVPPHYTFAISDVQYTITFTVMLVIGITISALTARLSEQLAVSKRQEFRTASLFQLTKQLSEVQGTDFLATIAGLRLQEIFEGEAVLYTLSEGKLECRYGEKSSIAANANNAVVAQWVAEHEQMAGFGTDTLPSATALFLPLVGSQRTVGAIGVRCAEENRLLDPEQRRLLATCASLIALSIERDWSLVEAQETRVKMEAEELRSSLLSSVSHDLRTPLAAIAGASSDLLRQEPSDSPRRERLEMIVQESHRMNRLIENLLNMTRLESGASKPNRQWHVLEEIVGSAMRRLGRELSLHQVQIALAPSLPLVNLDDLLFEQVLVNLLENAARYTPPGSEIGLVAEQRGKKLVLRIRDNGPGIPSGSERSIFEKFVRAHSGVADGARGSGLGLAICKAIVQAHGGSIAVENRTSGGAEFTVTIPSDPQDAPELADA
jgi:two-component system sensor histidine kinase KdpD